MDHYVMRRVLHCVGELGRAKSREVAERLGLKVKHVSVVLKRCKRRGYVEREPYKRGREHGFVNWLTERGKGWLRKKAEHEKKKASDLSKTSSHDLKSSKRSNFDLMFLMLKKEELERENQKLRDCLETATWLYLKARGRDPEKEFIQWEYLSLKSQLERMKEAFQSLASLLKRKDKIINDLRQRIIESERRSRLPKKGYSLRRKVQVEFKLPSIKQLNIWQPQMTKATSLGDALLKGLDERLRLRYWYSAVDQWWDWLPRPSRGGYITESVPKNAYNEKTSEKTVRLSKSSKSNHYKFRVPTETPRLPYDLEN